MLERLSKQLLAGEAGRAEQEQPALHAAELWLSGLGDGLVSSVASLLGHIPRSRLHIILGPCQVHVANTPELRPGSAPDLRAAACGRREPEQALGEIAHGP